MKIFDFQEWMSMSALGFTFLTNIEVWADNTFVSDANNRRGMAFITGYMSMNNLRSWLFSLFNFFNLLGLF